MGSRNALPQEFALFIECKNRVLAHRNRSNFCDLRLRCPSRTPEIAVISETIESNAALRFKAVMESRSRFAISGCDF